MKMILCFSISLEMGFYDGGQLFKRKVHIASFRDYVWAFDRLPYTDIATKTSNPPDHAKVTTRSDTLKR